MTIINKLSQKKTPLTCFIKHVTLLKSEKKEVKNSMGEKMEVKIQCSCGELTYALPEKIVEIIEKAEKEMPGSKEKALKQIEIALHCVINTMLGACLCAGPEGFEVVLSGVLNGIMPIQQANILTMAVDKFERELTEAAKKQGG